MTTDLSTRVTTESTLLRDIATAIEERQTSAAPCRTTPLTRQAAELFAQINGWHWSFGYRFEPQDLGKYGNGSDYHRPYWCDHALYFRGRMDGKRGWVNIAIAGQPYQRSDSVRAELEELEGQGTAFTSRRVVKGQASGFRGKPYSSSSPYPVSR